ncbi:hypothetical protein B0O99DRAFT_179664 [Bisporella sp. PMI_857]|nr:hypothetical protein B0O99DRAFT_179664 [Bisporella sp. PMI_857]
MLSIMGQFILIVISASDRGTSTSDHVYRVFRTEEGSYLKTSRQVRYSDLEAKSPLFSHTIETGSDLDSIRAHRWWPVSRGTTLSCLMLPSVGFTHYAVPSTD